MGVCERGWRRRWRRGRGGRPAGPAAASAAVRPHGRRHLPRRLLLLQPRGERVARPLLHRLGPRPAAVCPSAATPRRPRRRRLHQRSDGQSAGGATAAPTSRAPTHREQHYAARRSVSYTTRFLRCSIELARHAANDEHLFNLLRVNSHEGNRMCSNL